MASLGEAPEIHAILGWFELSFLFGTAHGALICTRDFCGNSNKIDTDLLLSFPNVLFSINPLWPSNGGLWGNAGSSDEKELTSDNALHVAIGISYFGIYSLLHRRRNAWYASELGDGELLATFLRILNLVSPYLYVGLTSLIYSI